MAEAEKLKEKQLQISSSKDSSRKMRKKNICHKVCEQERMRGFTWALHFPPLNRTEEKLIKYTARSWPRAAPQGAAGSPLPTAPPALGPSWCGAERPARCPCSPLPNPPAPSWGHPASFCAAVLNYGSAPAPRSMCSVSGDPRKPRGAEVPQKL